MSAYHALVRLTEQRYALPAADQPSGQPTAPPPPAEVVVPRWTFRRGALLVATFYGENTRQRETTATFLRAPKYFVLAPTDDEGLDRFILMRSYVGRTIALVLQPAGPRVSGGIANCRFVLHSVNRSGSPPAPLYPELAPYSKLRDLVTRGILDNGILCEAKAPYAPNLKAFGSGLGTRIGFGGLDGYVWTIEPVPYPVPAPSTPDPSDNLPDAPSVTGQPNYQVWAREVSNVELERYLGLDVQGFERVDAQGRVVLDCRYDVRIVTHQLAIWRGNRYMVMEVVVMRAFRVLRLILARI